MTPPGIYLVNSTGEMVALATEDGEGDRTLLCEALAEHTALDVDALDGTPERTWMENYDDEPEYVGVYDETTTPTCEWYVCNEDEGFETCGADATHTLVSRLSGRTAELATCDKHGIPKHAGKSLFTRDDAAADEPEVMTDGGVEIVPVRALDEPDTDDNEVVAVGMDAETVRAWDLEDHIIDEDGPHWSDELAALAPGERVTLQADTYNEVVADGGRPQGKPRLTCGDRARDVDNEDDDAYVYVVKQLDERIDEHVLYETERGTEQTVYDYTRGDYEADEPVVRVVFEESLDAFLETQDLSLESVLCLCQNLGVETLETRDGYLKIYAYPRSRLDVPEFVTDGGYVECTDKLCEGRAKWALWMPRREDFSRVRDPHPSLPYEDGDKHPYVCDSCLERYEWRHGHNGEFVRPEEKLVTDGGVPDPEAFRIPTIDELDAMRVEHGLSQRELSRRAGVEEGRFHHILQHDVDPQTETMRSFLDVLQDTAPQTEADLASKRGPKPKPSPLVEDDSTAPTWADVDPEDYATDGGSPSGSIYPDQAACKSRGCDGEIVADGYCSECPSEDAPAMADGGVVSEEDHAERLAYASDELRETVWSLVEDTDVEVADVRAVLGGMRSGLAHHIEDPDFDPERTPLVTTLSIQVMRVVREYREEHPEVTWAMCRDALEEARVLAHQETLEALGVSKGRREVLTEIREEFDGDAEAWYAEVVAR